jgi:AcrR family transcriptional regulator
MLSNDNLPTRGRSLQAAIEVVREEGLQELTTRAIARRSGLTQPAIYRHFASKEELVREVLGEARMLFYRRMVGGVGAGTPLARLAATLDAFRDFAVEEPRLYDALFLQIGPGAPAPPPVDPAHGGNIFGFLVERVVDCVRTGEIRGGGPVGMALSLAAHAQGLVLLYRQGRFGSADRFTDFYTRSMVDVVRGLG